MQLCLSQAAQTIFTPFVLINSNSTQSSRIYQRISASIDVAIIALIVATPPAALAIWVMFKRKAIRERRKDTLGKVLLLSEMDFIWTDQLTDRLTNGVENPQQMPSYFPMQRWRRYRMVEVVDCEIGSGISVPIIDKAARKLVIYSVSITSIPRMKISIA